MNANENANEKANENENENESKKKKNKKNKKKQNKNKNKKTLKEAPKEFKQRCRRYKKSRIWVERQRNLKWRQAIRRASHKEDKRTSSAAERNPSMIASLKAERK